MVKSEVVQAYSDPEGREESGVGDVELDGECDEQPEDGGKDDGDQAPGEPPGVMLLVVLDHLRGCQAGNLIR